MKSINRKLVTHIFIIIMMLLAVAAVISSFFLNEMQRYVVYMGLALLELNLLFVLFFLRRNLRR